MVVKKAKKVLTAKRLEEYEPGATKEDVMASLRKTAINIDHETPPLKEEQDNGKAN